MSDSLLDLLIIGGGINGMGIGVDAAGRGLKVAVFEQGDFAGATSSMSSKLIHGGLRYLEQGEFRLVKEALAEREILLKKSHHLVRPLRFCLPYRTQLRPRWLIRCGLFLYDHLAKRSQLSHSQSLNIPASWGFLSDITQGFEYFDCWVDDARLVIANAQSCTELGGEVRNYSRVCRAEPEGNHWRVFLEDVRTGEAFTRCCRVLINAGGPWVNRIYQEQLASPSPYSLSLIKGSHLVVPRPDHFDGERGFILQNDDQRVVFVLPYLERFLLIGTTDVAYSGDPADVAMDEDEKTYLLTSYNTYFSQALHVEDVLWHYSGVRPLCDSKKTDPKAMSRDYTLTLETELNPPLLSVFGGKLTTYRCLAESALTLLQPLFPSMTKCWTESALLSGTTLDLDVSDTIKVLLQRYPWWTEWDCQRLVSAYGAHIWRWLALVTCQQDLGVHFGQGFYEKELQYLVRYEWATSVEDIVWRRSKLGLLLSDAQLADIAQYIEHFNGTTDTDIL